MDTLLTEIIDFSGTAKGIPAYEAGPQLRLYFSMLRVLEPLCRMVRTIMDPHLLQRRSARKSASRLSYRGFAR
jgi:hypothetical protein